MFLFKNEIKQFHAKLTNINNTIYNSQTMNNAETEQILIKLRVFIIGVLFHRIMFIHLMVIQFLNLLSDRRVRFTRSFRGRIIQEPTHNYNK